MTTPEELLKRAEKPAADAMRLHPFYRGKVQTMPKCAVRDLSDFSIWYTPGVAAPCKAIQADPDAVYEHTNKGNTVAVVSDGSRVLGLGNIGPAAGLPVMEGKALIFKLLGGVDAVPICLATQEPDEIVRAVQVLEPAFGGINLEDIAQPKCFRVLEALSGTMGIPVWHDDQQGTATVLLAALMNALQVVGKALVEARIALLGTGAAGVATFRLLAAAGADLGALVACDTGGTLHPGRADIAARQVELAEKWRICGETNRDRVTGGIAAAMAGADACIAFTTSGPGIIEPAWVAGMARDAILFACANPVPEIWPWEAKAAGARIVGTGRGDFENQVNNALGFPGIFRGVLDVRARAITDTMAIAAARELATCAGDGGLGDTRILPTMSEWRVGARVAAAIGMAAQEEGLARVQKSRQALHDEALARIEGARAASDALMAAGLIPPMPAD